MVKRKKTSTKPEDLMAFFKKQLGSREIPDVEEYISTGSTLLDYAIANKSDGGVPIGRITELSGDPGSGKSLISSHILANTQKKGGYAIYIDTEKAAKKDFMKRVGIDWDNIIYRDNLDTIESVFEFVDTTVKEIRTYDEKTLITIVWDSVGGTIPQVRQESDYLGKAQVGDAARAMSQWLPRINEVVKSGNIAFVCTNQLRTNINTRNPFADPNVTMHGRGLPFFASVRVKLTPGSKQKDKMQTIVGITCHAKVFKNRLGPNHRSTSFPLMFDWGIDDEGSWLEFLKDVGIVPKPAGAWHTLIINGEEFKFQKTTWKETLQNKKVKDFCLEQIKEQMVITFDNPPELDIDTDSILEMQQLADDIEEATNG